MWPRRIQPYHCAELGGALAALHIAGGGFAQTRRNNLSVDAWRPLFESCADGADSVEPGLSTALASELDFLETYGSELKNVGVMVIELHPALCDLGRCEDLLGSLGFENFSRTTASS